MRVNAGDAAPSAGRYPAAGELLDAMPSAVFVVDGAERLASLNPATEQLFDAGLNQLVGRPLEAILAPHALLLALVRQVREKGVSLSDYGIELALARGRTVDVDAHLVPLAGSDQVMIVLHRCSVGRRLDRHPAHRGANRSIAALAQTLAHEVKNPLSGIRGAAQLLAPSLDEEDRALVRLICDETDRIVALVDRMDVFTEQAPPERRPVNIHRVSSHVRLIAESGFARHLRVVETYDPSLPEVAGDRDQLVQMLLNLVKNAAEAAPREGGVLTLATRYQHGLRVQLGTTAERLELPITIEVRDNGAGVPPDMIDHLFEPFVSGRPRGRGLGLSIVAKIVADHGGMVAYAPGRPGAIFRVRLPAMRAGTRGTGA
ncbi:MAG: PAS domain-containing protein [Geminicoccaceae bacterium]|nr:PAS domain-containing protein [Geminicoccaceae bacterium]